MGARAVGAGAAAALVVVAGAGGAPVAHARRARQPPRSWAGRLTRLKKQKKKRANRGTACGTGHGPQARCWTRASQRAPPHVARSPPPPPDARRVALPRGRRRPLPMDTPLGCALQLARAAVAFGGTDVRCPWAGPCAGRDRGADRSSGPRAGLAAPARAAPPGGLSTSPSGPWSHGGGTRVPPTARRGGGRDEHGKEGPLAKARARASCPHLLLDAGTIGADARTVDAHTTASEHLSRMTTGPAVRAIPPSAPTLPSPVANVYAPGGLRRPPAPSLLHPPEFGDAVRAGRAQGACPLL